MGRFYKATPGQFIEDKMFQVPFKEIAAVIGNIDKNIDETYDEGREIQNSLDSEKLDIDDPAVSARYQHYDNLAEQSAIAMDKDPLSFRKQIGKLRRTSRELATEMKTGVIGRAEEQHTDYSKITADTKERKDLKQETKDLYDKVLLEDYGGLQYNSKTGDYRKVKDYERDLIPEIVDENAFINEVANGFEFHSQGGGGSWVSKIKGIDSDVIKTSTTNKTVRSATRVRNVMKSSLAAVNYRGSREQFYEMQQDLGELEPTYNEEGVLQTPEDLAIKDETSLIERAVDKIEGKRGHTNVSVKSVSSVRGSDDPSKIYDIDKKVNNIGDSKTQAETKAINTKLSGLMNQGFIEGGYGSLQDLILGAQGEGTTDPTTGEARTYTTVFNDLQKSGEFTGAGGLNAYNTWMNNILASETNRNSADALPYIAAYNSSEQSQDEQIYTRDSNNNRVLTPYKNRAQFIEENSKGDYVVVPISATETSKIPTYTQDSSGAYLDKEGNQIMVGGVPARGEVTDYIRGEAGKTYKTSVAHNIDGNSFKVKTPEEFSLQTQRSVDNMGGFSSKQNLVHNPQWVRLNTKTGVYETLSVDIVVPADRFTIANKKTE